MTLYYRGGRVLQSTFACYSSLSKNLGRRRSIVNPQQTMLHLMNATNKINNTVVHRRLSTNAGPNRENKPTRNTPPQMPDKDTELRLADLQATITEAYKQGDFKGALTKSKDFLKETQQHFGYNVDHPATASAMNNVGLMHKLLGNFAEARQHYVAAMRIYASIVGRDHASYAMTLHNLGNLNKTQVHFDTSLKATERLSLVEIALDYLQEAYAIRIAELGAEHPHTVASRSAIGSTLAAQVLYQHKQVETNNSDGGIVKKQYVSLNTQGVTQQQWRAAEDHLRASLSTAIDNPRGKQIPKAKKNTRKQNNRLHDYDGKISKIDITTLSAASAAQNLAVFLKSFAMTMNEDSSERKQQLYEAKNLYEYVVKVRSQLLTYSHPDLYATKYSLAELLDVLEHQKDANKLRQEIMDTYDPKDLEDVDAEIDDVQKGTAIVVVEKTLTSTRK